MLAVPTRTERVRTSVPATIRCASSTSAAIAGSRTLARPRTNSPSAVGRAPRWSRVNTAAPNVLSIRLSWAVRAGCVSPSAVAARVTEPCSATVTMRRR